jgi:hypothetical protein
MCGPARLIKRLPTPATSTLAAEVRTAFQAHTAPQARTGPRPQDRCRAAGPVALRRSVQGEVFNLARLTHSSGGADPAGRAKIALSRFIVASLYPSGGVQPFALGRALGSASAAHRRAG